MKNNNIGFRPERLKKEETSDSKIGSSKIDILKMSLLGVAFLYFLYVKEFDVYREVISLISFPVYLDFILDPILVISALVFF